MNPHLTRPGISIDLAQVFKTPTFLLFSLFFFMATSFISDAPMNHQSYPFGEDLPPLALRQGKDYALFFAVNEYQKMNNLQNPIRNAKAIASELETYYGFQTEVVENPTLEDIEKKLEEYKTNFATNRNGAYDSNGQLLIFFSGHGIEKNLNGFFMPKDVDPRRVHRTAISYNYWRDEINNIDCKHILVGIDACFSATFDPSWRNRSGVNYGKRPGEYSEGEKLLVNHEAHKARLFFTADANAEETPDRSTFAKKFLEGLQSRGGKDGILTSSELFTHLELASPKPHRGEFGDDEAGSSFLFMLENPLEGKKIDFTNTTALEKDLQLWKIAKERQTIAAYQEYLRQVPHGEFKGLAITQIQDLEQEAKERAEDLRWEIALELNSLSGFQTYQSEYPNGKYTSLAKQKINALKATPISSSSTTMTTHDDRMIFVKGGTFEMGCTSEQKDCRNDEKPAHQVTISDFYLGRYEVTNKEFCLFLNDVSIKLDSDKELVSYKGNVIYDLICTGCEGWEDRIILKNGKFVVKNSYENHPVVLVTWDGAFQYCNWKSKKDDLKYRLPTEAEWEFAARGGHQSKDYKYAGGNDLDKLGWHSGNSNSTTHPVGEKLKNELGLYDMTGNVWEWCSDWYDSDYYKNSPQQNPKGADSGSYRVVRGGSWYNLPADQRVAYRSSVTPSDRSNGIGFRISRAAW